VVALGGITANNLSVVKQLGFGGAALLGDVWQHAGTKKLDNYLNQLICQIK
jgi:thiamine-phosphate pyrophosphorylase